MSPTSSPNRFLYASLVAVAFIIYGSLYPFAFHGGSVADALHTLFLGHQTHTQSLSGLIANIALYAPFGLFCVAAQNHTRAAWHQVIRATALGAGLCLCIETTQFFDAGRVTTLTDVYPNIAGTLIGALLALPLTRWFERHMAMESPARQTAALLLLSFLAYRLFPYAPTLDLHAYWRALKPVVLHPAIHGLDIGSYAVIWMVVAALLADLVGRVRSRWLIAIAMLGVIAAKIVIIHNRLALDELIALPIALIAWQLLSRLRRAPAAGLLVIPLALVVLGDRLLPFDWQPFGHAFGWVPFASIMHGSMATNTQALAEKIFLYSSLIWLLTVAGLRHAVAGALVAAGLFAASMLETHLPGRSAQITDAIIAIAAAVVLAWMTPRPRPFALSARR